MGEFVQAARSSLHRASGLHLPPILGEITKPIVQVVLAVGIVIAFFTFATRKLTLVPSRSQFVAETIYDFARNTIARDQIGGARTSSRSSRWFWACSASCW